MSLIHVFFTLYSLYLCTLDCIQNNLRSAVDMLKTEIKQLNDEEV